MTQQLLPFPDRSREIYACDVLCGYFPLTGILNPSLVHVCVFILLIFLFIYFSLLCFLLYYKVGDYKPGYLFGTVKIHKPNPPLHPIILQMPTPVYEFTKTIK